MGKNAEKVEWVARKEETRKKHFFKPDGASIRAI